MNSEEYKILDLPKILDERGNISFFENEGHIPFKMRRVYWIYDVPGGEIRGGHAFRNSQEVIIALSGSFDVVLSDGKKNKRITLNRSYYGLYIPKMIWRHMENFSTNSLAFVATDTVYDSEDYIREYELFQKMRNEE